MNRIITDNHAIYFLLEQAEALPANYSIDHVKELEHEESFYVIVYLAAGRSFTAFESKGYLQDKNILPGMLQLLQGLPADKLPEELLLQAIKLVENKIHSKDNSRFYFDAH
ncbi:MAG: hypothetical protein JWO44_1480 [Bacteroidetes bacterium]|jgi:hypothetical protein|nr:hypothetical protein [Bacteroidota bacterium]